MPGPGYRQVADDDAAAATYLGGGSSMDGRRGAKRAPMRSSIACLRCRRSKIKCDNDGKATTPCYTCIKTGKECRYPEAQPLPPKRPEPPPPARREGEGESERKRPKKQNDGPRQVGPGSVADDVLSASFLNETMWTQVFDIYRIHFATELPFLHMPTLKEKMGNKFKTDGNDAPTDTKLVLLGILTLTARFHPDLTSYVIHAAAHQSGVPKSRQGQRPARHDRLGRRLGVLCGSADAGPGAPEPVHERGECREGSGIPYVRPLRVEPGQAVPGGGSARGCTSASPSAWPRH